MKLFTNIDTDNNYSENNELLNLREMREWHKDVNSCNDEKISFNDFLSEFTEIDSKTGIGYFTSNVANNKYKLTINFDNCKNKNIIDYNSELI